MTATAMRDTPHILLVDENPQDLALIQESCADCSLPAVFHLAHDGEEALAMLPSVLESERVEQAWSSQALKSLSQLPALGGDALARRMGVERRPAARDGGGARPLACN